jgi:phosphate transport system substrate-binding protein
VEPLLRAWIERYKAVAPNVTIDYEAAGSAAALDRLEAGEGDFFASEVPLSEVTEAILGGSEEVVQVPWAAGPIVLAYNLSGVEQLRLSPDVVAGIFTGRIQRWDDASIQLDNPDVRLPNVAVVPVYRSDSSGTTNIFTSYLRAAAGGWEQGSGFNVRFPRGQGAQGSEGVVAAVKRNPGAIGYLSPAHARQEGLGVALLGNRAGRFLAPTPDAVNAALAAATGRPFGTTVKLLFTPDSPGAYPLATVSYLLFPRKMADPAKAAALRHFAAWALAQGQRVAEQLGYVPVPRQLQIPALAEVEQD